MFDDIVTGNNPGADKIVDYEKQYRTILQQIENLADFIMVEFQDEIGKGGSMGAVDEAIRLLKQYKSVKDL